MEKPAPTIKRSYGGCGTHYQLGEATAAYRFKRASYGTKLGSEHMRFGKFSPVMETDPRMQDFVRKALRKRADSTFFERGHNFPPECAVGVSGEATQLYLDKKTRAYAMAKLPSHGRQWQTVMGQHTWS